MILFIAPNPNKVKEREGFLQRVAAVDSIFKNEQKIYFDDISSDIEIAEYLLKANIIYVHSIYQASKILSQYPDLGHKIITDLHGVVPEEEELAGNNDKSLEMQLIEKEVFKYGKTFVAVTSAMVAHYKQKYRLSKDVNWVVLPIFDTHKVDNNLTNKENTVIYAGGAQKWQNVDKMVAAMNKTKDKSYNNVILTHDISAFAGLRGDVKNKTIIKTVPSKYVFDYYNKASMGFVLRNDSVVNRVACPTKLIEYLASGVVPIVLSPDIGDFNVLGYSYINFEDYIASKDLNKESLRNAATNNFKVLQALIEKTKSGKVDLINIYNKLIVDSAKHNAGLEKLIEKNILIQKLSDDNNKLVQEVRYQKNLISDYQAIIQNYSKQLDKIKKSIPWKIARTVAKPVKKINNKL